MNWVLRDRLICHCPYGMAFKGQGEPLKFSKLRSVSTILFRRVELTFADETLADRHLIIKSPMDREEGPVGP